MRDRNGDLLGGYQRQPDGTFLNVRGPGVYFAFAERDGGFRGIPAGSEVEELGYGPCNDAPADEPFRIPPFEPFDVG